MTDLFLGVAVAAVPKYEADIDVSPVYHPDAAQDSDCDCCKGHCDY